MKYEKTITDILSAEILNERSSRYGVIPHKIFIEELKEELNKNGHYIKEEMYLSDKDCQVIQGRYILQSDEDIEMLPSINFINSYNGTRKASIQCSSTILVCKNGMMAITDHGYICRKHIGEKALPDLRKGMLLAVAGVEEEFERLRINRNEMENITLSNKNVAQLIGDMYLNEGILTETQIAIVKNELQFSKHFKDNSLWSLFNHCTEAAKSSHPSNYDKTHIKIHTYISDKYKLTGSRGLYKD